MKNGRHKDYVKRAKDYNRKQKELQNLQRKAFFRNQEEFNFGMIKRRMKNGKVVERPTHLTPDELKLMDTQDTRYVGMREQIDKKSIARQAEQLHFLGAEKTNKHTLFIDEDELVQSATTADRSSSSSAGRKRKKLEELDVAQYLDTHPALLGSKSNRLRQRQLETAKLQDQRTLDRATKSAYKTLFHTQERSKRLCKVREALETKANLRGKGHAIKIPSEDKDAPAQYRWRPERKR